MDAGVWLVKQALLFSRLGNFRGLQRALSLGAARRAGINVAADRKALAAYSPIEKTIHYDPSRLGKENIETLAIPHELLEAENTQRIRTLQPQFIGASAAVQDPSPLFMGKRLFNSPELATRRLQMLENAAKNDPRLNQRLNARAGDLIAGRGLHAHPNVILGESELIRTGQVDPGEAAEMIRIRRQAGELGFLKRYGIAYGKTPIPEGGRAWNRAQLRFNAGAEYKNNTPIWSMQDTARQMERKRNTALYSGLRRSGMPVKDIRAGAYMAARLPFKSPFKGLPKGFYSPRAAPIMQKIVDEGRVRFLPL